MVVCSMETGLKTKWMGLVTTNMPMEFSTTASTSMIKSRDMGSTIGQMVELM
jgi:hypothetical protein